MAPAKDASSIAPSCAPPNGVRIRRFGPAPASGHQNTRVPATHPLSAGSDQPNQPHPRHGQDTTAGHLSSGGPSRAQGASRDSSPTDAGSGGCGRPVKRVCRDAALGGEAQGWGPWGTVDEDEGTHRDPSPRSGGGDSHAADWRPQSGPLGSGEGAHEDGEVVHEDGGQEVWEGEVSRGAGTNDGNVSDSAVSTLLPPSQLACALFMRAEMGLSGAEPQGIVVDWLVRSFLNNGHNLLC